MKIAAGIVVYNLEDLSRFEECLNKILHQVDAIYIFDNSEKKIPLKIPDKVIYLSENKNLGIAYALNRIIEMAKRDGCSWVITMDQDSIIPDDMIEQYTKVIEENDNLGIICPQVIDNRRAYMEVKKSPKQEYVDFCITSGSCTSIKAWEKIGKFDEWLFVDLVDNEFCKRIVLSGYKILRINVLILNHEFGKIIPKSKRNQDFWIGISKILHNYNFAKFSYRKYVSPMRVYYTCRNIIYANKKLALYGPVAYKENYNCNSYFGFVLCFVLPSILRACKKTEVIKAVIEGTLAGKNSSPQVWQKYTK